MKLIYKEKNRKILDKEVILKKVTNILLSGWLMKFYLWFNHKSAFYKSMNDHEKANFSGESFIGTINPRSFIENHVLDFLKMFDLSNFDEKEFAILEDFLIKFKKRKLQKELDKIKEEIRKAKIKKYKEINLINQENEINTNLNNNNIINDKDIDEKELDKIDVEYKVKIGATEININTIKFKQFYYLLESKVFKSYLNNSFLFKSIILKLKSFIENNFDYFTYLIMIINHMHSGSLLSMFYPLSIFCFALLENPRPKKFFWQICLYYTLSLLAVKFIFQLKLFSSIFDTQKYSEFVNYLYKYKIGIKYFDEGFSIAFFNYIFYDAFLLLIYSLNKNILISSGLWDKREEQIENIFQASERVAIYKDYPSIQEKDQHNIWRFSFQYMYYLSKLFKMNKNQIIEMIKEEMLKEEKEKKEKEEKERREKEEKERREKEEKENNVNEAKKDLEKGKEEKENIPNINMFKINLFFKFKKLLFYEKMKNVVVYDEAKNKYFVQLFPNIRNQKPGTDKYPFLALSLTVIILYILLFFTQMAKDTNYGPVDLDTTQFSGNMVLFLLFHVAILVIDRIIYISQNKFQLEYKYFIYKKNRVKVGIKISKQQYQEIKDNFRFNKELNYIPPRQIQDLKDDNFIEVKDKRIKLLYK